MKQRVRLVAALAAPFVVYALTAGEDRLIRFFPDDAFYYLQPAFNFARTGRVTFDGVHVTNGFHPLNFLVTAALAVLTSKSGLLVTTFVLDALMMLAGLAIIVRTAAGRLDEQARSALLCLVSLPVVTGFVLLSTGMEAALVVLATAWVASRLDSARAHRFASARHNALLGLGMAVFVLARLDLAIALLPAVAVVLYRGLSGPPHAAKREALAALALMLAIPAAIVGAYLAINVYATGHVMPISGYVKALAVAQPHSWTASTGGTATGLALVLLPLVSSLATLIHASYATPSRSAALDSPIVLLNLGNVLFYAYLMFGVATVFRWYFAFPFACLALNIASGGAALGDVASRVVTPKRLPMLAGLGLLAAIGSNGAYLSWVGGRETSTSYQLKKVSALMARHGGAGAVSGVQDSGVIGYFSVGRVINLDGLANDYEYVDRYLRPQRVGEYLCRERVTHLLVRDGTLLNRDEVSRGTYTAARSAMDPRLALSGGDELFRYRIPGQFEVYYYRFPAASFCRDHQRRSR